MPQQPGVHCIAQAITAAAFEEVDTTLRRIADAPDEILGLSQRTRKLRYASCKAETVKTTGWLILLKLEKAKKMVTLID
jgi:hypothetical protein